MSSHLHLKTKALVALTTLSFVFTSSYALGATTTPATSTTTKAASSVSFNVKTKIDASKQIAVKNVINNRTRSYQTLIAKLEDRIRRINKVSVQVKALKKNTNPADALLVAAHKKLEDANTVLVGINASTTVASTNVGKALTTVKASFATAGGDIKEAHKDITAALEALLTLVTPAPKQATSTQPAN